jgi:hypothetical protein
MKRIEAVAFALLLSACTMSPYQETWTVLLDGGAGLENWHRVGDANWRPQDGAIVADAARNDGYLVSRGTYRDFQIRAEFWADHTTNSAIFIRLADSRNITPANGYEINIFDQRPDSSYGTGAIVDVARVSPMPRAGGRWNTLVITALGQHLIVELNGSKTVDVHDARHASGPIALQFGNRPNNLPGGAIKWRKVQIRSL